MRQTVLCIIILLSIAVPKGYTITGGCGLQSVKRKEQTLTPMQALDLVKEQYAANFEKHKLDTAEKHYYKLPYADYYLVYEGAEENEHNYTFHLYEFVLDEPETGIGHTVTYGWYTVDRNTGEITDQTQE